MKIEALINGLDLRPASDMTDWADRRICDLTEDSRTVMPGSLFIARPGLAFDGRKYIGDAVEAGAIAILTDAIDAVPAEVRDRVLVLITRELPRVTAALAERFHGNPSGRLTLAAVTGTNGKTTVSHLIHRMVNDTGIGCGLIGTVAVDEGSSLAPAEMTTPPALEVSRSLAQMIEAGYEAAALEVSSHAIDQGRSAALEFDVAVFTNLSGDHLDYHGTMDAYANAKAKLFAGLSPDAVAVINIDDEHAHQMMSAGPAETLRCTAVPERGADAHVVVRHAAMDHLDLQLVGPWGDVRSKVPLVGQHNAMNVLQAMAAVHAMGVTPLDWAATLATCVAPPGRLEAVTAPEAPFAVLVDYAHTDDALENVLRAVRPLTASGGQLWVVFGCGGDRDRTKRPRMAEVACRLADRVVVTSDNPRTEQPESIIDDIMDGVPYERRTQIQRLVAREAAIAFAVAEAREGDIVVVAGKGHEDYQILPDGQGGTVRRHFDDAEQARSALERRGITTNPVREWRRHRTLADESSDYTEIDSQLTSTDPTEP
jgi:UDP-N-acetylmuramoyl-L-alanyl-D-glutamate--2,6-diaminopimelate ligase